jgi:hypothetical protein
MERNGRAGTGGGGVFCERALILVMIAARREQGAMRLALILQRRAQNKDGVRSVCSEAVLFVYGQRKQQGTVSQPDSRRLGW